MLSSTKAVRFSISVHRLRGDLFIMRRRIALDTQQHQFGLVLYNRPTCLNAEVQPAKHRMKVHH